MKPARRMGVQDSLDAIRLIFMAGIDSSPNLFDLDATSRRVGTIRSRLRSSRNRIVGLRSRAQPKHYRRYHTSFT
jgi:hypothetical protein